MAPVPQDTGASGTELDRLRRELDRVSRQSEDLQAALVSNRRIGMAIGILVVSRRLTDEAASECLRRAGDQRHAELRLVAEEVIPQASSTSGSAERRGRRPWRPRRGSPAAGRAR